MIDRVEQRFEIKPERLTGEMAYGAAEVLGHRGLGGLTSNARETCYERQTSVYQRPMYDGQLLLAGTRLNDFPRLGLNVKCRISHNTDFTISEPSIKSTSARTTRARNTRAKGAKMYEHHLLSSHDKVTGKVRNILRLLSMLVAAADRACERP
jgi:hypothetical protein